MSVFEHIKRLYEQELYSNVVQLVDLILPASLLERGNLLSSAHKYQTLVYQASALHQLRDYKRSELHCRRALQYRKSLAKSKGSKQPSSAAASAELPAEMTSEADVRYRLHLCLVAQRQHAQAIGVLEAVPAKQRSVRVNMALGRLYEQAGTERSAITAYKEVLRECPLAVEAARALLQMGVKGTEVACLMVNGTSNVPNMEWVSSWLRAHSQLACCEYSACAQTLRQLEERSPLHDNVHMQVTLGRALYCSGDPAGALAALQRAHAEEPHLTAGTDLLAALYQTERRGSELAQLAQLAAQACAGAGELHPEPWLVLGHHAMLGRRPQRALYFAHKAAAIAPRHVEALVLKGTLLLQLKKTEEAVVHFREALQAAPSRFEPLSGLVDCYVSMGRLKEAVTLANGACKQMGYTARALTLCAGVMLREPLYLSRARSCLERALAQEPHHLPAALLLAEVYEKSGLADSALELLRRQLHVHACSRLHVALAELLTRTRHVHLALQHFQTALNLEPGNERAARALRRLEADPDASDLTFEADGDEPPDSDNDMVADDSDSELGVPGWAEMDLTFGT